MRELRVDMFGSVDGFVGPGPKRLAYWGYGGPELDAWVNAQLAEDHVMLMGANTYLQMADMAKHGGAGLPRMSELPKIVFSKTVTEPLTWPNTTLISEGIETAIPELKANPDGLPMRTIGSPSLVRSLLGLGLVDRVRMMVFPMIHGTAGEEPVFAEVPPVDLELIGSTVLDDRLVLLDYRIGAA